jgi:hypothetical protein
LFKAKVRGWISTVLYFALSMVHQVVSFLFAKLLELNLDFKFVAVIHLEGVVLPRVACPAILLLRKLLASASGINLRCQVLLKVVAKIDCFPRRQQI